MSPNALRSTLAALALAVLLPAAAVAQPAGTALDRRMDEFHAARKAGDSATARAILEELVAQSYPRALVELAEAHRSGEGAEKDPAKALKLHERAASAGVAASYSVLGSMYWSGEGTAADGEAAFRWWRKGLEVRDAPSMFAAAQALEQGGPGVARNLDTARVLYVRAMVAGHEGARKRLRDAGYRSPTDVMAAFNRIVQQSGGKLLVANYKDNDIDGGTFSLYRTSSGGAGGNVVWMMDFGVRPSQELRTVIAARVRKSDRSASYEAQQWRELLLAHLQLPALNAWVAEWDSDLKP